MKIYIVMICDVESIPVRQQLDTLWYSWEDAAERVRYLNGLYEKNSDGLHAYYFEGVVK